MDSAMKPSLRSTIAKLPLAHVEVAETGIALTRRQAQEIALATNQERAQAAIKAESRDFVRMLAYIFGAVVLFFGVLFLFIRA
jgi:cobalamin biosynthesis protein CobT